jgi:hypothetical protein
LASVATAPVALVELEEQLLAARAGDRQIDLHHPSLQSVVAVLGPAEGRLLDRHRALSQCIALVLGQREALADQSRQVGVDDRPVCPP